MHQSHTYTNTHTHTRSNKHKHNQIHQHTKKQTDTHYHYKQLNVGIWQVLRIQVDGSFKKGLVVFVIFLPPAYTVDMTLSRQWVSTWTLRTGHMALSTVPSKTEHRILYAKEYSCPLYLVLYSCILVFRIFLYLIWYSSTWEFVFYPNCCSVGYPYIQYGNFALYSNLL